MRRDKNKNNDKPVRPEDMENKKEKQLKIKRNLANGLITLGIAGFMGFYIFSNNQAMLNEPMDYNKFIKRVENKEVKEVIYDDNANSFKVVLKGDETYKVENPKTDNFREYLLINNVNIKEPFKLDSTWIYIAISGFSVYILWRFIKNSKGLIPNTQMNSHKVEMKDKLTLNDVACNSNIKKEMLRLIDYMKRPEYYNEKKAKFPNGILFYGPPGTGKTLLAKTIAAEAKCNFYALSGSDFVEMYVGRGASRVRNLFQEAKKNAPSIIFIDEIDAVGTKRGQANNQEMDQTVNALLNELDGFSSRDRVMVIAATNRLNDLDPALIRAGRFGKHINIPLPSTKEERMKIINIHKIPDAYDETVDFDAFARLTRGCSGADISAILNDALLISIAEGKEKVDKDSLDKAFNQHIFEGHQSDKKGFMSKEEQRLVAYHEAGHAIVSALLCKEKVSTISIIGTTTGAGGYTISTPEIDVYFENKKDLENRIIQLYAGRAAENLKGYENSVGAHNDIKVATRILYAMYTEYGMMPDSALINYNDIIKTSNTDMIKKIEKESNELYERTSSFLHRHMDVLDAVAERLLEAETIDEKEFEEIISEYKC